MASWKQWTLTQKGQQFQAKVNTGLVDEVKYTKFALGSGIASGSLESLTELVQKEMDLPMKSIAPQNNAVEFNTLILNNDVETDFYCREMGLYVTNPDDGEILYAVSTDNYPDLMPAAGGATVVAYNFTLILIFSNTGNVVSYVRMEALATMQDIENHNTNADAHANLALLINDALAPTKDNDTLKNLLSGLAYMITKITGKDDWKAAPVISIAAILSSLSDNVAVNWDGNKFTVPALGVSGLMAQNGYVNFGKLVGGLIIQWGFDNQNDSTNNIESYSITIPLSTSQVFSYATGSSGNDLTNILKISGNTMIVRTFRSLQTDENNFVKRPFHYIIVCK
ncbi:hypothetical protein [Megasphaera elsdenii]|uniref:hypothetical protein n=1 Tax=Megasphaera elsdenii TaxID=907 RepID=UPI0036F1DC2A